MGSNKKQPKKSVFTALAATVLTAALAAVFLLLTGCRSKGPKLFTDTLPPVEPDPGTHVRAAAAGEPDVIYMPPADGSGYRYGPSIMYYADGSCDA
ncbi:MAG: hypothetical protein J6X19_00750, partial [Clostridia bacterium]|nr:hypothetical protein [Clostridia bacterium]